MQARLAFLEKDPNIKSEDNNTPVPINRERGDQEIAAHALPENTPSDQLEITASRNKSHLLNPTEIVDLTAE